MSRMIEEYYQQAGIMPFLLKRKMAKLQRNPDILHEFEFWIKNHRYTNSDCVAVQGYTAQKLAAISEYLDGEGAFMLLIELREHPESAIQKIASGFVIK